MKLNEGTKVFSLALAKNDSPEAVSVQQLALINKISLVPLTAEQVYIRPMYLCHNAIDLTRERFSEALLKEFLDSLSGKSMLLGHDTDYLGYGILFDGEILKMPPAEANVFLGIKLNFPATVKEAQILKAWVYIPLSVPVNGKSVEMNQAFVANIEAGVYRFVSIGFSSTGCVPVVDEKSGETLYWELKAPGNLREASFVYLGAQPGATIAAKSAGVDDKNKDEPKSLLEKKEMDKIKAMLGLGADADHAAVEKLVAEKLSRLKYLETVSAPLAKVFGEAEPTAEQVKGMALEAADGKAYKGMLVDESLKLERLAKRLPDDEKSIAARKAMLMARPVADLQFDLEPLRKSAASLMQTGISGGNPNGDRADAGRKTFIEGGK